MNFSFNVAWAHRYYLDYQKVPDGWYIGVNEAYKVSLYMISHNNASSLSCWILWCPKYSIARTSIKIGLNEQRENTKSGYL